VWLLIAMVGILVALLIAAMTYLWTQSLRLEEAYAKETALHALSVDMRAASDLLTSEAREYVVSGDTTHLENYWNEVDVTKTSDLVLRRAAENGAAADEIGLLETARRNREALATTELRAMRLMLESQGVPEAQMPPGVAGAPLNSADSALNAAAKANLATSILNDASYSAVRRTTYVPIVEFGSLAEARGGAAVDTALGNERNAFWILVGLTLLVLVGIPAMIIAYQSRIRSSLRATSLNLSATAQEILATAEQQERTAAQQSASIEETTATMAELDTSTSQSAANAEVVAGGAQRVLTEVDGGTKHVDRMTVVAAELRARSDEVSTQITLLSEQIGQIQGISAVVRDLAGQTNLLALNAAVEAARAGESGKGFSVVAAEIRKLADESGVSAERIGVLVSEILKGATRAVDASRAGAATVSEMLVLSDDSSQVFERIAHASGESADGVRQILLNLRQQAVGVNEVVTAMGSIQSGARETVAGISQVRVGVQSINDSAEAMRKMV